jgi:putative addiction module component (TIGR02574 family)
MMLMKTNTSKILKDALNLPPKARAELAGSLLDSLDESLDPDSEAAWQAEIAERMKELNSSAVRPIPWSDARRKISGS